MLAGMEQLRSAADRFAVGELFSEDLPMVAAHALARDIDSPALIELACLHRNDCGSAPDLFLTALRELDLIDAIETDWPSREGRVLLRRALDHAAHLVAGAGDPLALSGHIASLLYRLVNTDEPLRPDLAELADDFEVLNVYWEDGFGERERIIENIRHAARNLLDGPPYESVFQRADHRQAAVQSAKPHRFWHRFSPGRRRPR